MGEGVIKMYIVYVDDNFHYMDKSERYKKGEYETEQEAVDICRKIVQDFMDHEISNAGSAEELRQRWLMFGDDPFIKCTEENRISKFFSAADYAKEVAEEMFQKTDEEIEKPVEDKSYL